MNEATLKRIPRFIIEPEKGFFGITGRSYPENVIEVYRPMLEALKEYVQNPMNDTILELRFDFCSTSTSKVLITIFETLEDMLRDFPEHTVHVSWFCEEDDEDKYELGEDLKESTELPFKIVIIEEN